MHTAASSSIVMVRDAFIEVRYAEEKQPMRKYAIAALVVSIANGVVSAQALTKTVPGESTIQTLSEGDPVSWVRPKIVVPPEYPSHAIEKKLTGYVDADILVTEEGSVSEIRSLASTPKNEDFEEAVREVLKLWTFHEAASNCRPYETVGNVRVWFDMKGDAGVVSVSNRTPVPEVAPRAIKSGAVSTNAKEIRSSIKFPRRALRAGAQGSVYILFRVEPATGAIASIEVAHARSTPRGYEDDFVGVSKAAVAKFKFEPMLDRDKPVTICVPFTFRMTRGSR